MISQGVTARITSNEHYELPKCEQPLAWKYEELNGKLGNWTLKMH